MNLKFLISFLKCRNAAKANHISGWLGTGIAAGAGFLVSSGYIEDARKWVCEANADDIGLAIAAIGATGSLLNSGATKALAPKESPPTGAETKPSGIEIDYTYPK